jgi:hypothetical protein
VFKRSIGMNHKARVYWAKDVGYLVYCIQPCQFRIKVATIPLPTLQGIQEAIICQCLRSQVPMAFPATRRFPGECKSGIVLRG